MAGAGPNCPSNATQTKFQRSNRRTLTFTRIESASPCPMRGLSAVTALSSLMSAWAASELAVHAPIAGMRRLWRHVRLVHQLPLAACERNWVFAQAQRGIHPLTPSARLLIPLTCLACMTPWPNIAAGAINHRGTSNRVRCRVSGSRKNSRLTRSPPAATGTVRMRSRSGWTAATRKEPFAPRSDGITSPGAMCWHEGTIVVALGWLSLSTQS